MRFMKKVAGRGNLTLPRDIREAMEIEEGDIIEFEVVGVVRKNTDTPDSIGHDDRSEATA